MRIRNVPLRAFGPGPFGRSRYRGLGYFGSFGTASQYQSNKECPVGGSWEDWCDCVFPEGDLRQRCRSKPFPGGWVAPWTEVGAAARGLPKPGSLVAVLTTGALELASTITKGAVQGPPAGVVSTLPPVQSGVQTGAVAVSIQGPVAQPPEDEGIFGIPRTIALVGGGILAAGVAVLAMKGKNRR